MIKNNQSEYVGYLTNLGLTDKEAAVYMALLLDGADTAENISKAANLNRSTTYVQITSLTEKGLVSTFKKGKKTYFAAESPNNINRILEKKSNQLAHMKTEASLLIPRLFSVFSNSGSRPSVRMFEGKEGLMSMRNDILNQKTKEIFIISSVDHMKEIFTSEELQDFTARREKNKTESYLIYSTEDIKNDYKPYK